MSQVLDPMDSAIEEAERPNFIYGQLEASASFVMFANKRKVAWTEMDDPKERRTEVSMLVNPIEETGLTNFFTRSVICSNNNEWATIVWPSLRDNCKVANLREAHQKWVKAEIVKTGRSYINKSGDKVENTTFKFVALFNSKEACAADYLNEGGVNKTQAPINDSGHGMTDAAMDIDMSSTSERTTAEAFLPALVKMANGNADMLAQQIAGIPMVAKFFTVNSPEVQKLLKAA